MRRSVNSYHREERLAAKESQNSSMRRSSSRPPNSGTFATHACARAVPFPEQPSTPSAAGGPCRAADTGARPTVAARALTDALRGDICQTQGQCFPRSLKRCQLLVRRPSRISTFAAREPHPRPSSALGGLNDTQAPPPAFRGTSTPCAVDAEHEFLRRKKTSSRRTAASLQRPTPRPRGVVETSALCFEPLADASLRTPRARPAPRSSERDPADRRRPRPPTATSPAPPSPARTSLSSRRPPTPFARRP